jgi:hypothetical protein
VKKGGSTVLAVGPPLFPFLLIASAVTVGREAPDRLVALKFLPDEVAREHQALAPRIAPGTDQPERPLALVMSSEETVRP